MKTNEKGFSAIEIIIVIAILGLLGGVGLYVFSKQNTAKTPSVNTSASKSTVNSDTPKQAPSKTTVNWLLEYTSQNKKFSVYVPDGWKLESTKSYDGLYSWNASEISFKEGTTAEVHTIEGGRDGSSIAFSMWYNDNADELHMSPEAQKVKTYKTVNGIVVDKYTRTQTKEPEGMDIPTGATEYKYILISNNKLITITHDVLSEETEQTALIEQMIETVKFL